MAALILDAAFAHKTRLRMAGDMRFALSITIVALRFGSFGRTPSESVAHSARIMEAVDGGADHGHAAASEGSDELVCKRGFANPVDAIDRRPHRVRACHACDILDQQLE
jgi:hypothetical protein